MMYSQSTPVNELGTAPIFVIVDTNIVLDVFVFNDPAVQRLKEALASGHIRWLATLPMRDELARVLAYPKIVARLALHQIPAATVLVRFDAQTHQVEVAPKAPLICSDPDDQMFIDLAVMHKAILLSKDDAVLRMAKRLLALEVRTYDATEFLVLDARDAGEEDCFDGITPDPSHQLLPGYSPCKF